jgi:high-affinity nickel permease
MSADLLSIMILALILGLRHGVDWDHIAAITDLVGAEEKKKEGFIIAAFYVIGHELVIIFLGFSAVLLKYSLPAWVDGYMEKLVGVTLIILSIVLLNILLKKNKEVIMISKWRLAYNGITHMISWLLWKLFKQKTDFKAKLDIKTSKRGAIIIGFIHGIGAETPSQILLFAAAMGTGTTLDGVTTVLSFAFGLLVSHLIIVLISVFGYAKLISRPIVLRSIGVATSIYSIVLGTIYIFGAGNWLPKIL